MLRLGVKTITDFTGVIQLRNSPDLGGLYWTVNMFLALLTSFVCVWFGGGGREEWALVLAASGAWLLVFVLFLLLMKKGYRRTFFSTQTGCDWAMDFFRKGKDDEAKQNVLGCNKMMLRAIRGEVKEWVLGNWYRWIEEKPNLFTEAWLSEVPADFIPLDENQIKLNEIRRRGGGRRGSSPADALTQVKIHPSVS